MMKWRLSAFFGVVFGLAGIAWGYAQAPAPTGFFELRVYTALPGQRDALAARFSNRTAAIYARHGITNVGYLDSSTERSCTGHQCREHLHLRARVSVA